MLPKLKNFVKKHTVTTLISFLLLAGVAFSNLTNHTESLLDALIIALDSTGNGSFTDETWYIYLFGEPYTAFTASDTTPDVITGSHHAFQTANVVTFTNFDDGSTGSTIPDGAQISILCLHAVVFDFTSSGLFSQYGEDYTATVGEIDKFEYDKDNTRWVWTTPKSPTSAIASNGIIARVASGLAAAVTITGTANEITVTDGDGESGGAGANPTISVPSAVDWTIKTFKIPNAAGSGALTAAGMIHLNSTNKLLSGYTDREMSIPFTQHRIVTFDPKAVCDGAVDRLFLMTIGDDAPFGIKITKWTLSFEADPTTEADLDFKRADAFIGVANAAVMDVLDTTAGASSEATAANINGGAVAANGKVLYLEFGTTYTETTHQIIFEYWYEVEED